MNGIEKITARIEQDTGAEIEVMEREAQAKAQEIRRDYAAQAAAGVRQGRRGGAPGRPAAPAAAGERRPDGGPQHASGRQAGLPGTRPLTRPCRSCWVCRRTPTRIFWPGLRRRPPRQDGRRLSSTNGTGRVLAARWRPRPTPCWPRRRAPDLAGELKGSKAGNILSKVVTGASALLQGTALLTLGRRYGGDRGRPDPPGWKCGSQLRL